MAWRWIPIGRPRGAWRAFGTLVILVGMSAAVSSRLWLPAAQPQAAPVPPTPDPMILLAGGTFRMGDDLSPRADQRPAHDVSLDPFWIDEHAVTNRQFAQFVQQTGYLTTAERQGWGYVFGSEPKRWSQRQGADWRHPGGPSTRLDGREEFPVVQVSWHDAAAYAAWANKALPTEAQWEYAARAGLRDNAYPWGNSELVAGHYQANYWQGKFPDEDSGADGFRGVAPVRSFPANRFGLFDVAGNVWQWCADWYGEDFYRQGAKENPAGPSEGQMRVLRGGSYLSPQKASPEYSSAHRSKRPPDACYGDVGFRCVRPAGSDRP